MKTADATGNWQANSQILCDADFQTTGTGQSSHGRGASTERKDPSPWQRSHPI
jgi:hypothetical protein